ncbi:L-Lysine-8-amino-7-oxononanoate aminotransferase [Pirellula sp. SH-Sr6A]|uniref:adenosylmethionine--8-amino-7-oxononanoate transaminase n=1 Tax=Pirellula sp. SH-Sr6A TaxID=1632865 RepID=UPI00078C48EC|nr:adenosylmethionine--8-amino-7-oxononanoate transaminase [Pirellula sp. SH-Sr6A]AMV34805.1 L-Lysine-8-amino-7-oxononanoate aminotransferase [Pirellula sp. SH-Sr6A]
MLHSNLRGDESAYSEQEIRWLQSVDRETVWHAFSQMADYDGLIIDRGEGNWLIDIQGNRYLDAASSLWCNVHGHSHPRINQAIVEQLAKVAHVTNLGMSHPETIRLADRLIRLAPDSLEHVFFCCDGASAVEVAMKMAFQFWKQSGAGQDERNQFLVLGNAYHGDTIGTVSVGGVERFHRLFGPLLFPVLRGPCPTGSRIVPHQNDFLLASYLREYRLLFEQHAREIAAVIVEPLLQCAAGMVFHPPGFLSGMAALCREFDTLLIVDEIAVGMGRCGRMFACEYESVQPDVLCIGKGLTGGYLPMSAALTSGRVFDAFLGDSTRTLYHGHTYGGNPLSAAAANATLDLTQAVLEQGVMGERVDRMDSELRAVQSMGCVQRVDYLGMLGAIEWNAPSYQLGCQAVRRVCDELHREGIWLRPLGNTLPIVPPLSITDDELSMLFIKIRQAVQQVAASMT